MKTFKKYNRNKGIYIILLLVGLISLPSCDKDFGDINDSFEANLTTPSIGGLFNDIIASTKKGATEYRIPVAWLYQWNQQAAMYSASGFRLDDWTTQAWKDYYRSLANSNDIENLISTKDNPGSYRNINGMLKTIMAYKTLRTTLMYGDIPYKEAGKGFLSTDAFRPVYDSQQSVMETALTNLSSAIDDLSSGGDQKSLESFDTFLSNDIDQWIKFANSLILRYAMVMVDKNPSFAQPLIASALNRPLLSPNEHFSLSPANIPNLENNREGFYRGNSYIRMGSTMWEAMSSTNAEDGSGIYDLRCSILFEPNNEDKWKPYPQNPGADVETVLGDPHVRDRLNNWDNNRSNFATINVYYVQDHSLPQFLLTGSQISFLKAEIYNRGIGVAANPALAETNYNEGITASVNFWYNHAFNSIWNVNKPASPAPSNADLEAMLNNPNVAYSDNPSTALSQIYKQSWIALFHQPFEAWTLQRRTGNQTPNVTLSSSSLVSDFNRLTYPPSERETNRENWTAVTGGTSDEKVKTWIQK